MNKTIAAMCVGLVLAGVGPAFARTKYYRHANPAAGAFVRSSEPARMIEVRPGLWVSSYQCVVDLDRGGRDCSSGI